MTKPLAAGLAAALVLAGCDRAAPVNASSEPARSPSPAPVAFSGPISTPGSFAPIIKQVSPAVVSIDTLAVGRPVNPWLGREAVAPVRRGAGSGFIIAPEGYVVTNNHVVENAQEVVVSLADGRQFPARLVGRDPPSDLAVVKIDGGDLPFVSFARAALPEVGDWVVAVGNPFGLGGTATAGIVSGHGREIGEAYVSYLQIDAPINSGNSGGPSFDLQGRVVGVNTAIFSPTGGSVGIGFAIPADLAQTVTEQLIKSGRVTRGYIGVGVEDLTPALAAELGVRGRRGAVINGVTAGGLTRSIAATSPGGRLMLSVIRNGRPSEVSLQVARRPDGY